MVQLPHCVDEEQYSRRHLLTESLWLVERGRAFGRNYPLEQPPELPKSWHSGGQVGCARYSMRSFMTS